MTAGERKASRTILIIHEAVTPSFQLREPFQLRERFDVDVARGKLRPPAPRFDEHGDRRRVGWGRGGNLAIAVHQPHRAPGAGQANRLGKGQERGTVVGSVNPKKLAHFCRIDVDLDTSRVYPDLLHQLGGVEAPRAN